MDPDDLVINGELVLSGTILQAAWLMWLGEGGFSSDLVRRALAGMQGDVTVRVNSPGGDPVEGEAIRSIFAEHDGRVTCIVEGQACSAASLMIMGADRIEMTSGAVMMIHDPSSCFCGTEAEMRTEADALGILANTYASVYAERSGMSVDAVRTLMRATQWYGPTEAVEAGFADVVRASGAQSESASASPDVVSAAQAGMERMQQQLRMCAEHFKITDPAPALRSSPAVSRGQTRAMQATTEEIAMDPEEVIEQGAETGATEQATAPAPPPSATGVTMQAPSAPDAALAERTRIREITALAQPFMASGRISQAQVDAFIDRGMSADAAGSQIARLVAEAEVATPTVSGSPAMANRVGREQSETDAEGMIGALMGRTDGPAAAYRGMTLRRLAMHLAGPRSDFLDTEAVRRGMRSRSMAAAAGVSDFAYITTEAMNRTLMEEYRTRAATWRRVTGAPMRATDFRELHAVRFGGDMELKPVLENGEYETATLSDEAEGLKVERFGRAITLTFEAVVDDDMGAFTRLPNSFARAARSREAKMVWSLIRSNAVLKSDGQPLFHSTHGNTSNSTAISVDAVGKVRKAMWEQTAFGSKDKDDFIEVQPGLMVVPPALESKALQHVELTMPTKNDESNPFRTLVEPLTVPHLGSYAGGSDSQWYMVSEDLPPIAVAYLDGYEAPTVRTTEGRNPDNVYMDARHIFGAAVHEYRGIHRVG